MVDKAACLLRSRSPKHWIISPKLCQREDQIEFKCFMNQKIVTCLSSFQRMLSEMADILSWKSQMETSSQHSAAAVMKWK